MQMRIHGGRRRRTPETPWLLIATIIGIVVVIGAAFIYFTSPGVSSQGHASTSTATTQKIASTPVTTFTTTLSQTPAIVSVAQTPTIIPVTGVEISVSYLGGFNGSYSTGGVSTNITPNSGNQMYEVENATGSIMATFQKTDDTATHALTVIIYENGKQIGADSTNKSYGKVTITSAL
jgi:phosphoribosylcarboxyaminoimidazole (NCAIR) mutase